MEILNGRGQRGTETVEGPALVDAREGGWLAHGHVVLLPEPPLDSPRRAAT